jgi:hypothetical protein
MELRSIAAATAAVLCLATSAEASTTFLVTLTTSQEPTPVFPTLSDGVTPRAQSSGTGTFVLNDAGTALSFTMTIFNIDFTGLQTVDTFDNLVAAHIHAGANAGAPTFPVVWGFFGAPMNDNNPPNTVITPFASGVGATVVGVWDALEGQNTTLAAQIPNLLAGNSYVNFHTVQFPGGEVRGALVPVPEPATWAMMIIGFAATGHVLRRRRSGASGARLVPG